MIRQLNRRLDSTVGSAASPKEVPGASFQGLTR